MFIPFVVFVVSVQISSSTARLYVESRQKPKHSAIASAENRDIIDITALENEFRRDKCREKSNYTVTDQSVDVNRRPSRAQPS